MQVLAPVMVSTLSDDYDTSMRHLTCLAFRFLLTLLEGRLGEPQVRVRCGSARRVTARLFVFMFASVRMEMVSAWGSCLCGDLI